VQLAGLGIASALDREKVGMRFKGRTAAKQQAGESPGQRHFPYALGTDKKIGMGETIALKRCTEEIQWFFVTDER
jgi:hypothetical protein